MKKTKKSPKKTTSKGTKKSMKEESHKEHATQQKRDYAPLIVGLVCVALLAGFIFFTQSTGEVPVEKPTKYRLDIPDYKGKDVSFTESFELLLAIDEAYGLDYHEERLGGTMVKLGFIPQVLEEVEAAAASLNTSTGEDLPFIQQLYNFRIAQLKSQLYFQRALSYGAEGSFGENYDCKNKQKTKEATALYNLSMVWGQEGNRNVDLVLANYPPARPLIGTDKAKPNWFSSPLGEILYLVEVNNYQLARFCLD